MAEEEWKIGDIVRLKSGGPAMTIVAHNRNRKLCVWIRDGSRIGAAMFFKVELIKNDYDQETE